MWAESHSAQWNCFYALAFCLSVFHFYLRMTMQLGDLNVLSELCNFVWPQPLQDGPKTLQVKWTCGPEMQLLITAQNIWKSVFFSLWGGWVAVSEMSVGNWSAVCCSLVSVVHLCHNIVLKWMTLVWNPGILEENISWFCCFNRLNEIFLLPIKLQQLWLEQQLVWTINKRMWLAKGQVMGE